MFFLSIYPLDGLITVVSGYIVLLPELSGGKEVIFYPFSRKIKAQGIKVCGTVGD